MNPWRQYIRSTLHRYGNPIPVFGLPLPQPNGNGYFSA